MGLPTGDKGIWLGSVFRRLEDSSVNLEEACSCSSHRDCLLLHVLACSKLAEGQNASTVENLAL